MNQKNQPNTASNTNPLMKNTFRILLFLMPALLGSQLCHADPLNGGISTEDVIGALLLFLVAALVFVTAPLLSYLSYKRPGKLLNRSAWVMAIISKLACIVLVARSGSSHYFQLGIMASILPNISLYLLLLISERTLVGRWFQLAFFVHSILGIVVASGLLSLVLSRLMLLSSIHMFQVFNGLVMFGMLVYFIYQYLRSAASKGVYFAAGLLHAFVCGLAITLALHINNVFTLIFTVIMRGNGTISDVINIAFSAQYGSVFIVTSALLSGVTAYVLFNQKKKKMGELW